MELKKHQVPMSIDEQVENLKELGLIITDEESVKDFLNDVSYFRLIKAYSIGLKKKNDKYNQGITFDMIKELYLFNCNFRQALFAQIEKVEINLRCRIANHFSCKYGNFGYEDASNFENADYHVHFLAEINNEVDRNSKSAFVKNFRNNYETDKIPMYALIELFSFGTLSKFYKNMKQEDKKAIAQIYGVKYTYLESWIEHISFVRNICAHYGRLYNVNLSKTPALYKQYTKQGISSVRVFATLVCLSNILPKDRHWDDFIDLIEALFDKYPNVKMELMGFPENWKAVLKQNLPKESDITDIVRGGNRMSKSRVIIYDCYVPYDEDTKQKHFDKVDAMQKEIESYSEDYEIIGRFFDTCSATTPLNKRPEFQKVMEKVNTLAVDMIATVSMKYFSRSIEDTMSAIKTFQEKGVSLNCNAEHFDSFHIEIVEDLEFIRQLDLGFDDMDDIEESDAGMVMQ